MVSTSLTRGVVLERPARDICGKTRVWIPERHERGRRICAKMVFDDEGK